MKCSGTAVLAAIGRAIGAREPDPLARNPDGFAESFVGDPESLALDLPIMRTLKMTYEDAMSTPEVAQFVRLMTVRTRYIDHALERSVTRGVRQVVILGAGFDSRAYRYAEILKDARVFEIDQHATQMIKRQRVQASFGTPPAFLTYVPADLQGLSFAHSLGGCGLNKTLQTFFVMEGVSMYLTQDAVSETLRAVSALPGGSSIVMDFVATSTVERASTLLNAQTHSGRMSDNERHLEMLRDEPWRWGIGHGCEHDFFASVGLRMNDCMPINSRHAARAFLTRADRTQVGSVALRAALERSARKHAALNQGETSLKRRRQELADRSRAMNYQIAEATVARDESGTGGQVR